MMTVEEMTEAIANAVRKSQPGMSFVELISAIPEMSGGEYAVGLGPTILYWTGMSDTARKAFGAAFRQHLIHVRPCTPLIYAIDGGMLSLPLAKNSHIKKPPKKLHWLPVTLYPGPPAKPARQAKRGAA